MLSTILRHGWDNGRQLLEEGVLLGTVLHCSAQDGVGQRIVCLQDFGLNLLNQP
jgi:hypothetical protein